MSSQDLPFTISHMTEEEIEYRKSRGHVKTARMVRTQPGGVVLPPGYEKLAHAYYNFEYRSDDIIQLSYTKSGTVWTMEILWAMTHLDQLHLAHEQHIHDRIYFIDRDILLPNTPGDGHLNTQRFLERCPGAHLEDGVVLQLADTHQGPHRVISSHLPLPLLNPSLLDTCKVVYVARNPKDTCFSCYTFYSTLGNMGSLECCADLFMRGDLMYGSQAQHVRQAWQLRSHPNLHIMFYEDMKMDLLAQLVKLNLFLDLGLSEDNLNKVAQHTSFENMKAREAKIPILPMLRDNKTFYPGGIVGGWTNNVDKHLDHKMDQWITDNLGDLDINFKYM